MKPTVVISCILLFYLPRLWAQDNKDAFFTYCGGCHTIGNGKLIGPDLKDVGEKYSEQQLLVWVRASKEMQLSDSAKAALQPLLKNRTMPNFSYMHDEDVLEIVNYIKRTSKFNWIGPQPYHSDIVTTQKDTLVPFHFHKQKQAIKPELTEQGRKFNLFWSIYWLFFGF